MQPYWCFAVGLQHWATSTLPVVCPSMNTSGWTSFTRLIRCTTWWRHRLCNSSRGRQRAAGPRSLENFRYAVDRLWRCLHSSALTRSFCHLRKLSSIYASRGYVLIISDFSRQLDDRQCNDTQASNRGAHIYDTVMELWPRATLVWAVASWNNACFVNT